MLPLILLSIAAVAAAGIVVVLVRVRRVSSRARQQEILTDPVLPQHVRRQSSADVPREPVGETEAYDALKWQAPGTEPSKLAAGDPGWVEKKAAFDPPEDPPSNQHEQMAPRKVLPSRFSRITPAEPSLRPTPPPAVPLPVPTSPTTPAPTTPPRSRAQSPAPPAPSPVPPARTSASPPPSPRPPTPSPVPPVSAPASPEPPVSAPASPEPPEPPMTPAAKLAAEAAAAKAGGDSRAWLHLPSGLPPWRSPRSAQAEDERARGGDQPGAREQAPAPDPPREPDPVPEPVAQPAAVPEPAAVPDPVPEPAAVPDPMPEPAAVPDPGPERAAVPAAVHEPAPQPEHVQNGQQEEPAVPEPVQEQPSARAPGSETEQVQDGQQEVELTLDLAIEPDLTTSSTENEPPAPISEPAIPRIGTDFDDKLAVFLEQLRTFSE